MYYDADGVMKAAGAEAESTAMAALAEDEGWVKTELYVPSRKPYCSPSHSRQLLVHCTYVASSSGFVQSL